MRRKKYDHKLYRTVVKDRVDSHDRTIVIVETPYATRSFISSFVYGEEGGFLEFDERNMSGLFGIHSRNDFDEYVATTKLSRDPLLGIISTRIGTKFQTCDISSTEITTKINDSLKLLERR